MTNKQLYKYRVENCFDLDKTYSAKTAWISKNWFGKRIYIVIEICTGSKEWTFEVEPYIGLHKL